MTASSAASTASDHHCYTFAWTCCTLPNSTLVAAHCMSSGRTLPDGRWRTLCHWCKGKKIQYFGRSRTLTRTIGHCQTGTLTHSTCCALYWYGAKLEAPRSMHGGGAELRSRTPCHWSSPRLACGQNVANNANYQNTYIWTKQAFEPHHLLRLCVRNLCTSTDSHWGQLNHWCGGRSALVHTDSG